MCPTSFSKDNHQKLSQLRVYRVYYFLPVLKSRNHHPQVDSIFLYKRDSPWLKTVKCSLRIIGIGISKGISIIFFLAAILYRLYMYFD